MAKLESVVFTGRQGKFMVFQVGPRKLVVRGDRKFFFHREIQAHFKQELATTQRKPAWFNERGGGRFCIRDDRVIVLYEYSHDYGYVKDREKVVALVQAAYPDHRVVDKLGQELLPEDLKTA